MEDRGYNFDPDNYLENHVDRVVVSSMDKGYMAVLPGIKVFTGEFPSDDEFEDHPDKESFIVPEDELLIVIDGVSYGYDVLVDIVRKAKEA
jgi:hypothetical protein